MSVRGLETPGIFIALGSNLGDRERTLREGLLELCSDQRVRVVRVSRFHETEPVGGPVWQPRFLNAVAEIESELSARELLERMLRVEEQFGRIRSSCGEARQNDEARNGPRTLDLDLLIYRNLVIQEPGLTVPHPRMWGRQFVIHPLAEIADVEWLRRRVGPQRDR